MPKTIAVIGAGVAGLSAAHDLKKAGHRVTVYDRNTFPGGRMADQVVNGINVHTGASIIFSFNREMLALIDELGLRKDLYDIGEDAAVECDNGKKRYELRLTPNPAFLLGHKAFGVRTKAKLAALLPDMIAGGLKTDPCMMHTAVAYDDESVTDYITRKVSEEFLENYIEPYFRAPWHWEPENISRAYLLSLMGHVVTGTEYTFRQGIGHLTRTLAKRLDVELGSDVVRIAEGADGVAIEIGHGRQKRTIVADLVVCAVEGTRVGALVAGLPGEEQSFFQKVRYSRGARLYYALNHRKSKAVRRWFTRKHPSTISLYHVSNEDPFVPEGFVQPACIQAELTPQVSARVAEEGGQGRLDGYIRDDILKLYPGADDAVTSIAEQWWDDMLTEWYPGYARRMAEFLERQQKTPRRVYFCGDYLSQSHTGGACASGRTVARTLLGHLRG